MIVVGINPVKSIKPFYLNYNYRFGLVLIKKKFNGLKNKSDYK